MKLYVHSGLEAQMFVNKVSEWEGFPLGSRGGKGKGTGGIEVGNIACNVRSAASGVG
jgi:hypothetical protein